jgi:hypothetical protein
MIVYTQEIKLIWTADAYTRPETYAAALARIIDAHRPSFHLAGNQTSITLRRDWVKPERFSISHSYPKSPSD